MLPQPTQRSSIFQHIATSSNTPMYIYAAPIYQGPSSNPYVVANANNIQNSAHAQSPSPHSMIYASAPFNHLNSYSANPLNNPPSHLIPYGHIGQCASGSLPIGPYALAANQPQPLYPGQSTTQQDSQSAPFRGSPATSITIPPPQAPVSV